MSSDVSDLAAAFERHRPYVRAVALRMLGSGNDAERISQESLARPTSATECYAGTGAADTPARERES